MTISHLQETYEELTIDRPVVQRRSVSYWRRLWWSMRARFFPRAGSTIVRVCVPIHAFPVMGGTRAVLAGVTQVTEGRWRIEYLTNIVGPAVPGLTVYRFGGRLTSPWQFPLLLGYSVAGLIRLLGLMRRNGGYDMLLPQDGVFTGAFAAVAGKLVGVPTLCMDHGNLTLLGSRSYYRERVLGLERKNWPLPLRVLARLLFMGYLPTLSLLAWVTARCADHYLIPGVVGDGTEAICARLGIAPERLTRFGSMIDTARYRPLFGEERAIVRAQYSIEPDAMVVALICRLAPEKGLDIALQALHYALQKVPREVRESVRIVIAGDGPLRHEVEQTIQACGLETNCQLLGEVKTEGVVELLSISDIFLYTSIRGACLSMSVLEAMASGCAVIASTRPLSNEHLLAEGRGLPIPALDVEATEEALLRLLPDREVCARMGKLARAYVHEEHSPERFQQVVENAVARSMAHARQLVEA